MWIELHDGSREHPKTLKLARGLGIKPVQALGHMASLWCWTLRMSPDGDLSSFDAEDIAIGAQWEGDAQEFIDAAARVRFLDVTPHGLAIHDWEEFCGSNKTAQRVRDHRERKRAEKKEQNENVTLHSQPVTLGNAERQTERQTDRPKERKKEECSEPEKTSASLPAVFDTPTMTVPCLGGEHPVMQVQLEKWIKAYPALDIVQEIRKASAWLDANPANKKRNTNKFLVNWFNRAQDRAPPRHHQPQQFSRLVSKQDQAMELAFAATEAFNATR